MLAFPAFYPLRSGTFYTQLSAGITNNYTGSYSHIVFPLQYNTAANQLKTLHRFSLAI